MSCCSDTHSVQKYEWRMGLVKKHLIAWIRGCQARKMYRAMKAENDRKKLSKEQRAANKKAKEKVFREKNCFQMPRHACCLY